MKRHTIIVIINPNGIPETWGNFKKACKGKGWKYNTLVKMKMPIRHDGFIIYRCPFL